MQCNVLLSYAAKSEIARVKEDTENMNKAKVDICSKIFEKQKKIASLESDSSRLAQVKKACVFFCRLVQYIYIGINLFLK